MIAVKMGYNVNIRCLNNVFCDELFSGFLFVKEHDVTDVTAIGFEMFYEIWLKKVVIGHTFVVKRLFYKM